MRCAGKLGHALFLAKPNFCGELGGIVNAERLKKFFGNACGKRDRVAASSQPGQPRSYQLAPVSAKACLSAVLKVGAVPNGLEIGPS
jgi:hypothetical protein